MEPAANREKLDFSVQESCQGTEQNFSKGVSSQLFLIGVTGTKKLLSSTTLLDRN